MAAKISDTSRPLRHGFGVMRYSTGRQYEGDFLADLREGRGFELYPTGNSYFGSFK
jgi:hypothetical protein